MAMSSDYYRNTVDGEGTFDRLSPKSDAEFGRYRGKADMAGLAAGSTRSRMAPQRPSFEALA
jgi:hypothetical protein